MVKSASQLDREIDAAITPYVDPAKYRGRYGIKTQANPESPWRGTATIDHFGSGMFERDAKTGRLAPVVNGKALSGAACFSVDKINSDFPRAGTPEMKHLRKAWASRKKLAAFVRGLDHRGSSIRLHLIHEGGNTYRVKNYDRGTDLGTVEL